MPKYIITCIFYLINSHSAWMMIALCWLNVCLGEHQEKTIRLELLGISDTRSPALDHKYQFPTTFNQHPQYLGSMSCASTGCHGSYKSEAPEWNRAYLMWKRNDPHAQAYATLHSGLSLEMGKKLQLSEPPAKSKTCLVCHGYPVDVEDSKNDYNYLEAGSKFNDDSIHTLGVSCEACHGPSSQWIEPHRSRDWSYYSREQKSNLGFTSTKDVPTRIAMCAECHIGGGSRDVNHRLIAAGHPRLTFEYSAYMDLYAKKGAHWNVNRDVHRIAQNQNLDTKQVKSYNWAMGKLVCSIKSIKLSQERAANDQQDWPELAEFSCYACHHDLTRNGINHDEKSFYLAPSWRQSQYLYSRNEKPGQLSGNNWDRSLLNEVLVTLDSDSSNHLLSILKQWEITRTGFSPEDRNLANEQAKILLAVMDKRLIQATSRDKDYRSLRQQLLKQIDFKLNSHNYIRDWDEATQLYLFLAATQPDLMTNTDVKIQLTEMKSHLVFPSGPPKSSNIYNSPKWNDPFPIEKTNQLLKDLIHVQASH